uniref:Dynein regulatory complex protein 10 n=1 Tax=Graphocephala atropunctata TaxID=36148 RepID=A0A1B6LX10_9HEMI
MDQLVQSDDVLQTIDKVIQSRAALDKLEEVTVNCVLMKSINKLSILQELLPHSEAERLRDFYEPLPQRMTVLKRITLPEDNEHYGVLLLKQIHKISSSVVSVLQETVQELSFQGTYFYLEYMLCLENLHLNDNFILKQDSFDINQTICSLKEKIYNVKESFKKTESYLSGMMDHCLEQAVVQAYVESETLIRNTEVLQEARLYQSDLKLRERENALVVSTDKCNIDAIEENKINTEVENQIRYMTLVLQKKLDTMSNRYNREVETLDVAILQLKSKQDEQREQFQKMSELYQERIGIVAVLQEEMEVRERALEEYRIKNRCARVIQQWWRHLLFLRLIRDRISVKRKTLKIKPKGKLKKANKNKK